MPKHHRLGENVWPETVILFKSKKNLNGIPVLFRYLYTSRSLPIFFTIVQSPCSSSSPAPSSKNQRGLVRFLANSLAAAHFCDGQQFHNVFMPQSPGWGRKPQTPGTREVGSQCYGCVEAPNARFMGEAGGTFRVATKWIGIGRM